MEVLRQQVPVKFKVVPCSHAVAMLANELNIQIDIDVPRLNKIGLLDHAPVNLTMPGTTSVVLKQL